MSNWETIQDNSSHISPVKLLIQRDHSTERVDDMFEAIYKASHVQTPKPEEKKSKHYIKRLFQLTISFLLLSFIAFQWNCTTNPNITDLCKYKVNIQLYNTLQKVHHMKVACQEKINFNWPIEQYDNAKVLYTTHLVPNVNWIKEFVRSLWVEFQDQLDAYIESGRPTSGSRNKIETEDNFKATAKRIVDYFNKSRKTGMKQEEAREKAKEILNSMLTKTVNKPKQNPPAQKDDSDEVAYEIQSILKIATVEKEELEKQLSIIQSNIKGGKLNQHENLQDFELFIDAIKLEVEGLRMKAEDRVRSRTKSAMGSIHSDNPIVKQRIKQDLLAAQKAALKDLRQIYIKLHETNKMIDDISFA